MNRILFTFFIVFSVSLKSQSYTFDKVVTYQMNEISQNQNIINSNNDNYTLFLQAGNLAELFDRTTKVKHFFKVSYQINDNKFVLAKYKSEKSKKAKYEIIIKVEESEIQNFNFLHSIEDEFMEEVKPYLDTNQNYTITEMHFSTGYSGNKNVVEYDLKVEPPKNLIYKCEYPITSIVINNF